MDDEESMAAAKIQKIYRLHQHEMEQDLIKEGFYDKDYMLQEGNFAEYKA